MIKAPAYWFKMAQDELIFYWVGDFHIKNEITDNGPTWYTRMQDLEYLYRANAPDEIIAVVTYLVYSLLLRKDK